LTLSMCPRQRTWRRAGPSPRPLAHRHPRSLTWMARWSAWLSSRGVRRCCDWRKRGDSTANQPEANPRLCISGELQVSASRCAATWEKKYVLIATSLLCRGDRRRGDDLYEREVRARVEAGNHGRVVAIDIEPAHIFVLPCYPYWLRSAAWPDSTIRPLVEPDRCCRRRTVVSTMEVPDAA
jgi:hypothetical protein